MAERVTDLRDIRDRVVAELPGLPEPGVPCRRTVRAGRRRPRARRHRRARPELIVALATRLGGPTSHTAIIARQLGIPCVVAVPDLDEVPAGRRSWSTATTGEIVVAGPDEAARAQRYSGRAERSAASRRGSGPGRTADGHPCRHPGQRSGRRRCAQRPPRRRPRASDCSGPSSCFLDRDTEPDRRRAGRRSTPRCCDAFAGRKVVVRTLDAGSDKPLRFASHADEPNPALGVRGLRIAFADPGILDRQLDAIAAGRGADRRRSRG